MHNGLLKLTQTGGFDKIVQVLEERELFEKLKSETFDIVIINPSRDSNFSEKSLDHLQNDFPQQKILIFSDVKSESIVLQTLEKGIQGYLTFECDEDEIIHAIFAIYKGEKFYCNKVLDIVFNKHLFKKDDDNCEPTSLTLRETEITILITKGNTNKEVAEMIHLSPHTIHTHRKNIMRKLGLKSVSELTIYAVSTGLIEA